jgi:hypothetical protein
MDATSGIAFFHLRQIHCDCTAIQLGDVLSDAQNAKMALIAEP